jgi:hypothetical protein
LAQSNATLPGGAERIPIQEVFVYVVVWIESEISQVTVYTDIDDARAAAERLAESRA